MIYNTQEFAQLLKEVIRDDKRHDLYEATVEHAREMSVHILGDKPVYLLERARPREDENVKLYRIENYEPTTKAGADKAIKIVCKGFNPSLYSIEWKEKTPETEEIETYTLEDYPVYNSLINFNKDVVLRKMLADPNGLIAVKPDDIPDDDTKKVMPITVVYGSSALWYYDKDHYLLCVGEPDKDDKDQIYHFEYYDRTQYVDFTAYYDASDKSIEIQEITLNQHNKGKIPAWFLGGESKSLDNGKVIYQSFFSAALPNWNLAVIHESDLIGAYINHLHPQKYELAEECSYKFAFEGISYPCHGGIIKYGSKEAGKSIEMTCPHCGGNGLSTVKSPYDAYQFTKAKLDEGAGLSIMPAGYIVIPVEATKMLEDRTEKMNQKAMWAINMDVEDKVGEVQSGIAKTIDRSAQNDTLLDIHSRMFGVHLNNEYMYHDMYMNDVRADSTGKDKSKNLPEINPPTNFDLLTTSELIYNYNVSKTSGVDRNILRTNAINIVKSENGSTPTVKNYLIALIELDPLYAMDVDEIDLGTMKGVIRKVDWAVHNNIKPFLDKALAANPKFLTIDQQEQIKVLEQFGNELITAEKPKVDANMFIPPGNQQQQNAA